MPGPVEVDRAVSAARAAQPGCKRMAPPPPSCLTRSSTALSSSTRTRTSATTVTCRLRAASIRRPGLVQSVPLHCRVVHPIRVGSTDVGRDDVRALLGKVDRVRPALTHAGAGDLSRLA
jgi:hypothetical protein